MPSPRYCGRFAPSPTGPLHFGSLVAAMASYCDARAQDGRWFVRIEDIDLPRSKATAESAILDALERYGFEWDGDILRQSKRTEIYAAALDRLRARGAVYECACSRRELEIAPIGAGGERIYPGTCRSGIPGDRRARSQRAWRVNVDAARIEFHDRLQGPQAQDLAREVGDFVVKRADGFHAYHLAVVVDDAQQDVTHVVRGADLLVSTPRQIYLQQLLALPTLSYLHAPVAIDVLGQKLSKQTNAAALPDKALPALLAAWRFLAQAEPERADAPATVAEFWSRAFAVWNPERLPRAPLVRAPSRFAGTAAGCV